MASTPHDKPGESDSEIELEQFRLELDEADAAAQVLDRHLTQEPGEGVADEGLLLGHLGLGIRRFGIDQREVNLEVARSGRAVCGRLGDVHHDVVEIQQRIRASCARGAAVLFCVLLHYLQHHLRPCDALHVRWRCIPLYDQLDR